MSTITRWTPFQQMERMQRDFFLREQMKAIQRELGETDPAARDANDMRQRIVAAGMPEAVARKADEELRRMEQIPSASPSVAGRWLQLPAPSQTAWSLEFRPPFVRPIQRERTPFLRGSPPCDAPSDGSSRS